MKFKINYGKCHISVSGMSIECPFCKVLVKSGTSHDCQPMTMSAESKPVRKKKSKS